MDFIDPEHIAAVLAALATLYRAVIALLRARQRSQV